MKRSVSIFKDFLPDSPDVRKPRSRFIFLTSTLLAVILLYLALRGLDWPAFFVSLQRVNYLYVAPLLIWSSATYFLRSLRWRILLVTYKNILPVNVFWANMAGYLANSVLPARAGEFVRAAYIARKESIPVVFVLATGITERLVDLTALVIIGAVSLFFTDAFPKSVQSAFETFAVAAVIGVMCIFLLPLLHDLAARIINALTFLSNSIKSGLYEIISHFVEGLKAIANIERGLSFLFFTLLIWLMDGLGMVWIALSLHESLSLAQSLLFISALGISSAIPSTPGYIGVYQFVAITVLMPFDFVRESALALILITQALNLLVVSCWGGAGLWIGSRTILAIQTKKPDGELHD